jgi:hypothetical protein
VSIGVGIGIGISGLVIAAIVAFFLFRRRKLRASKIQAQHQEIMGHEVQDLYNSAYDNGIREQHGRVNGHEIPYGLGKPELDGLDRRKPRSNTKYYELPTPP